MPSEQEPEPSPKEECWKELSFISSLAGRDSAASAQQRFLPAVIAERWDGGVQKHPNALETEGSLSEQRGCCKRGQMYVLETASFALCFGQAISSVQRGQKKTDENSTF